MFHVGNYRNHVKFWLEAKLPVKTKPTLAYFHWVE